MKVTKNLILTSIALAALSGWQLQAADINAIYQKECQKCHGADGKGNTRMGKQSGAKDYTDPKVQAELKDDKAIKVIKEGIKEGGKEKMKPYTTLTDEEIKGLITKMREFGKK